MQYHKKMRGTVISHIGPVALSVVVAVFIVAMGAQMLGQLQDTQTGNTTEYNVTQAGLEGLGMFGDWWGIIILAVIIGIVVGVLFQYLGGTLTGRSGY
jgi:type II secretory pathway component PulF